MTWARVTMSTDRTLSEAGPGNNRLSRCQQTQCASLVADQLGEAQRRESGSLAQVNAAGVAQNLPEKARGEVPEVPRSNPLGAVALRELAYHRLDAAPHGRKPRRPGVALALLVRPLGGEEAHPVTGEVLLEDGAVVVSVADHERPWPHPRKQVVFGHPAVVLVGGGEGGGDDHPRPGDPKVGVEAVEYGPPHGVVAPRGDP